MTKKNNCALSSANAWGSNNRKFYDIIDCVKFILLYQVHSFIFFSLWSILIEFQFSLIYVKFNELERVLIQLTHLSIIVQFLGCARLFDRVSVQGVFTWRPFCMFMLGVWFLWSKKKYYYFSKKKGEILLHFWSFL